MAKDPYGTRVVQQMLKPPWNEKEAHILHEIAQNLGDIMLNPQGIFAVKSCLQLLLDTSAPDVEPFSGEACKKVMEHWDQLVSGRTSAFSYKMVMWMMEFLYMQANVG